MKNIFFVICNLAAVAFTVISVLIVANMALKLRIVLRGIMIPGDPISAVAFVVLAVLFGTSAFILNRSLEPVESGAEVSKVV